MMNATGTNTKPDMENTTNCNTNKQTFLIKVPRWRMFALRIQSGDRVHLIVVIGASPQ